MKLEQTIILTGSIIVLVLIAWYNAAAFIAASTYVDAKPRVKNVSNPKDIIVKWIDSEEYFYGEVHTQTIDFDHNISEIKITNHATGDDSVVDIEYLITVKMNNTTVPTTWDVISSKEHWKCRGLGFFDFWTTGTCS